MRLHDSKQQGFTLVELAIVLMIIGLLIGGILRGQELMNNARVTSTAQQLKAYQGALATFRDAYNGLPGDINNAANRIPGCSASPCSVPGNSDGHVGVPVFFNSGPITMGDTSENRIAWLHLSKAHLITGIKADVPYTTASFGVEAPMAPAGGGFQWFDKGTPPGADNSWWNVMKSGLWISWTNGSPELTAFGNGGATSDLIGVVFASQLDKKLDDGLPHTGDVLAGNTNGAACGTGGANAYTVTDQTAGCSMGIFAF